MSSGKKWKKTVDSDDEALLFPEGWAPKAQRVDSDDEVPLFSGCWVPKAKRADSDDEVPLFPEGWAPKEKSDPADNVPLFSEGCKRNAKRMRIEKTLKKSVPKSTRLDRALGRMQAGAAEVNLMRLLPRANMDDKLTTLITYAKTHQHVSSIELQGTPLGMSNGMPKSLNALARLLRERRIQFLGLNATGLDDFDGRLLASALGHAPPRDVGDDSDELAILDLTQNEFNPEVRAGLLAAGEKAGVRVHLSKAACQALRTGRF